MKINFIACLFIIILCAPVLIIISSLPIQNKLPSSTERLVDDLLDEHQVNATGATVIRSNEDDGRTAYAVLKYEIVNSKKSQGKRGAGGGGNNVVREPKPAKSNALPLLQLLKSFYLSVYICFSLFIVLCF